MSGSTGLLSRVVEPCASAWPWSVDVPPAFRRACDLLQLPVWPASLLAAVYTVATVGTVVGVVLVALGGAQFVAVTGLAALLLSSALALVVRYGVPVVARAKRLRMLSAAPSLVTMLTLGAALWGSSERATEFATRATDRPLADSLAAHARRAAGTPRSGLDAFASQWDESMPALPDAVQRIDRATARPPDERTTTLGSARQCVLEGVRQETSAFAAGLRAPATGLYAFGVLLPLALVSMLPAASAAGVPVGTPLLVAAYGVVLPAALCLASGWLLCQRPVAFPTAAVPQSHPAVPDGRRRAAGAGIGASGAAGAFVHAIGLAWAVPIVVLGAGLGAALVVHHRPARRVRERVTAIERGLPDALTAVADRIDRGQSVEAALADVAETQSGPLTDILQQATERQAVLGVDVETAFLAHRGALATVPSPRTRQTATLLGAAATIGPPAADSLSALGEHLSALRSVERDLRRDLAQVTGTLSNTAALFGPLVAGATVALAGTMGTAGPLGGPPVESVGLVVGWYVLVLAGVLTALSTGLRYGVDRARVGYRVGTALLSATATYVAAVLATRLIV
ncbi:MULTISPECIES: type II secretion system protein [Haloarcula]|uniref:type II secretion system protein n=1 Tax=Haloarcula TaxID=2237 RepID=UPI0023EAD253|nr:type II secretion system protein [Halomicroarcula sp. XH51]